LWVVAAVAAEADFRVAAEAPVDILQPLQPLTGAMEKNPILL
jgi:hypothetical protein